MTWLWSYLNEPHFGWGILIGFTIGRGLEILGAWSRK